jgi:hypothetical protein
VTAYVLGDGLWGNEILECSPSGLPGDNTKWHFYAATYNANTGVRCTYFDGALVAEQTGDTQYKTAPAEHLVIGGQEQTVGFNYTETQIYDVRVYNYDLTAAEVLAGFGMPDGTPAQIATQPPATVTAACEGVTVQIKAVSGGSAPVTNQWQLNGTNLVDGTYGGVVISGSASELLTIANATTNYQGTYTLVVANAFASVVSSNVSLTIGSTPPEPLPGTNLVGEWLAGSTTLNDVSGYSPAGTHNASVESGTTSWSTDVPPTAPAGSSSLAFTSAGLIVANSSTLDGATYTNTYDDNINTNGMSVICWAKGYPGSWNPWVSKAGDNSTGWQLRVNASDEPCWTMRGPGGGDDMASPSSTDDGNWHLYAGTYDPIQQLRTLYVDGVPVVQETGQAAETSAAVSHLMIGGKDNGGDVFGNYYTGKIFDVRIYNTPLTTNQINSLLVAPPAAVVFSAPPAVINGKLVLQWSTGSLEQATNLTGPWVPSGATSPYTNNLAIPQLFFRLSNP